MTEERINLLTDKYLFNAITQQELQELDTLLNEPGMRALAERRIDQELTQNEFRIEADLDRLHQKIGESVAKEALFAQPVVHRIHFLKTAWFRYAAIVLLVLGTGAYLFYNNTLKQPDNTVAKQPDIAPGTTGAILTLADGTQVVLDSLGNGIIANQHGAQVMLNNGLLMYNSQGADITELAYNTITTPKGRQFQIVLPDRTKVWLNAASSLKYPTAFADGERKVEITGEAYFEVSRDKTKPFFVRINNQAEVEVLGTSFNVNSYEDEGSIHTTLLEGSVRVEIMKQTQDGSAAYPSSSRQEALLKPGQQAQIINVATINRGPASGKTHSVQTIAVMPNADIEKIMAWKNGAFNFEGASLKEVMNQLERWYDIEVIYEKGIPDIKFGGEMSRDISLTGLIRSLEAAQVHFRIEEGRRLVVYP